MSSKPIDIGGCFSLGWAKTKEHLGFFIVLQGVYFLAEAAVGVISAANAGQGMALRFAAALLSLFVGSLLHLGATKISLDLHDGKEVRLGDLFSCPHLVLSYVGAGILYTLIVVAGSLLLIVPGLIWAIQFCLYFYIIVDKGKGAVESLKASSAATYGAKWQLGWFLSLIVLLNMAGALMLLVGLLLTIPTSMMAMAAAFRQLTSEEKPPEEAAVVDTQAAA